MCMNVCISASMCFLCFIFFLFVLSYSILLAFTLSKFYYYSLGVCSLSKEGGRDRETEKEDGRESGKNLIGVRGE